ncbi:MAG: hypothetical protein ACJ0A7_04435 [Alphaproteobacteria bacterium]
MNLLFFIILLIAVTLAFLYYNLLKEHKRLKKFASVFTMRDWHKKRGTEEEYNKLFEIGVKEVNEKLEEAENNEINK